MRKFTLVLSALVLLGVAVGVNAATQSPLVSVNMSVAGGPFFEGSAVPAFTVGVSSPFNASHDWPFNAVTSIGITAGSIVPNDVAPTSHAFTPAELLLYSSLTTPVGNHFTYSRTYSAVSPFTYYQDGTYTVGVTAAGTVLKDGAGSPVSFSASNASALTVLVQNVSPSNIGLLSALPTSVFAGDTLALDAFATDPGKLDNVTFRWTFTDPNNVVTQLSFLGSDAANVWSASGISNALNVLGMWSVHLDVLDDHVTVSDGTFPVEVAPHVNPAVPLPAAAWSGMALLGGLFAVRTIRRRAA